MQQKVITTCAEILAWLGPGPGLAAWFANCPDQVQKNFWNSL